MERLTLRIQSEKIPSKKALLTCVAVAALGLVCFGKTSHLSGKMVAYDLMRHASKSATFQQNQEVVVLETGEKGKYLKVIVSSFGTTQIDSKYFDGSVPLEVDAVRDRSCDESGPRFVPQANLENIAGTYLLTDSYKSHPPGRIEGLKCYAAIYKKK